MWFVEFVVFAIDCPNAIRFLKVLKVDVLDVLQMVGWTMSFELFILKDTGVGLAVDLGK